MTQPAPAPRTALPIMAVPDPAVSQLASVIAAEIGPRPPRWLVDDPERALAYWSGHAEAIAAALATAGWQLVPLAAQPQQEGLREALAGLLAQVAPNERGGLAPTRTYSGAMATAIERARAAIAAPAGLDVRPYHLVPEVEAVGMVRRCDQVLAWWQERAWKYAQRAERAERALHVALHTPHDQQGGTDPDSGWPICSVCDAIQDPASLAGVTSEGEEGAR